MIALRAVRGFHVGGDAVELRDRPVITLAVIARPRAPDAPRDDSAAESLARGCGCHR